MVILVSDVVTVSWSCVILASDPGTLQEVNRSTTVSRDFLSVTGQDLTQFALHTLPGVAADHRLGASPKGHRVQGTENLV